MTKPRKEYTIISISNQEACVRHIPADSATYSNIYQVADLPAHAYPPVSKEECRGIFEDYPVKIYSMRYLDENRFETGLRELIGVFKRSKSRQEMKRFYVENRERFARLDGFVIDAMAALLGESKLKLFAQEGRGLDLCKAFEDEREEGREEGRDLVNRLIQRLIKDGRSEEILTVVSDEVYQGKVLQEYGLG